MICRTFNKKFRKVSQATWKMLPRYDHVNMRSHRLDTDACSGFDFNCTINFNMFIFLKFGNQMYVMKDSQV